MEIILFCACGECLVEHSANSRFELIHCTSDTSLHSTSARIEVISIFSRLSHRLIVEYIASTKDLLAV